MSASEKTINTFATRVRQMILKFEDIKHENAELYAMVDERDAKIKELQEKLTQAKHDYDSLKMAKMMTISDSDMEDDAEAHRQAHQRCQQVYNATERQVITIGAEADQMEDKLQIRLHVYDTDLTVRIPREDEEYYRKSAKLIDEIVNSYAKIFKGRKSDKEILYMALIDVALRFEKESDKNDTQPYNDILDKLTAEIEDTLAK